MFTIDPDSTEEEQAILNDILAGLNVTGFLDVQNLQPSFAQVRNSSFVSYAEDFNAGILSVIQQLFSDILLDNPTAVLLTGIISAEPITLDGDIPSYAIKFSYGITN